VLAIKVIKAWRFCDLRQRLYWFGTATKPNGSLIIIIQWQGHFTLYCTLIALNLQGENHFYDMHIVYTTGKVFHC
jgi:hypothetical protein